MTPDKRPEPTAETPRWIGTLTHWDGQRGFGLFSAEGEHAGQEVAVHRTAFARQDGEPRLGEVFSFEVHTSSSGKHRALRVQRPISDIPGLNSYAAREVHARPSGPRSTHRHRPSKWLVLAFVVIIGALLSSGAGPEALLGIFTHTTP